MDAVKFSEQIVIDSSSETIFDFTQDYRKRLQWNSFLKKADLIEGAAQAGKVVNALCVAKNGLGMVTEYITFNRPFVTAIQMTKTAFFI
jgi:hypothetical protein